MDQRRATSPALSQVAASQALRQADRLAAELLGTVSHELRNPLAVIKGYAATMLRHGGILDEAERHEFLAAIGEACDRLEITVYQMLEMSQLETGILVPRFMLLDLEQLIGESVISFTDRMARASLGEH